MSKKSCQNEPPRIPDEFKGIQINCCKNTTCECFGLTPEMVRQTEIYKNSNKNVKQRQVREKDPFYIISGTAKNNASIHCKPCKSRRDQSENKSQYTYAIKSNKASYEEYARLSEYLFDPSENCANAECLSHESPEIIHIKKRGFTTSGTQRYHCMVCGTSYTGKPIDKPHTDTHIDIIFFKLLVSQVAFKRIEFILGLHYRKLIRRLNFIHRQCMGFVAERERRLMKMKSDKSIYLCTDRLVQFSNWTNRKEKSNCEFYGIGSADLISGYILGFHFNYDATMDPQEVELDALKVKDHDKKRYHQKYARVWLKSDFEAAKKINNKSKPGSNAYSLEQEISEKDEYAVDEDGDKSSEFYDITKQTTIKGMEVRNEYTMIGHFLLMRKLTQDFAKTRFFLDQDAGMNTWYLGVFKDEIKQGKSDGFFVSMEKDLTVDDKRIRVNDAQRDISNFAGKSFKNMASDEKTFYVRQMIIQNMDEPFITEKTGDRWVSNPMPSMAEPSKMVRSLTNVVRYDTEHQANLYKKASLHAIDRFFMQLRRKIKMFERPIQSGANEGRVWSGYSAYDPVYYQKLSDIFRVFYNYCLEKPKTKSTPAMDIGLAKGIVDIEKIIYWDKYKRKAHR